MSDDQSLFSKEKIHEILSSDDNEKKIQLANLICKSCFLRDFKRKDKYDF
jgi:hypothetical protein